MWWWTSQLRLAVIKWSKTYSQDFRENVRKQAYPISQTTEGHVSCEKSVSHRIWVDKYSCKNFLLKKKKKQSRNSVKISAWFAFSVHLSTMLNIWEFILFPRTFLSGELHELHSTYFHENTHTWTGLSGTMKVHTPVFFKCLYFCSESLSPNWCSQIHRNMQNSLIV